MADLFNARPHSQPLRAACYRTNYRNWEKTSRTKDRIGCSPTSQILSIKRSCARPMERNASLPFSKKAGKALPQSLLKSFKKGGSKAALVLPFFY